MSDSTRYQLSLKALASQYPTLDAASCEVARLDGRLTRRANTVHLVSDVHGANVKLRHILSNGSGALQRELQRSFSATCSVLEIRQIQKMVQYPLPMLKLMRQHGGHYAGSGSLVPAGAPEPWVGSLVRVAGRMVDVIRAQTARTPTVLALQRALPPDFASLLNELIFYNLPGGPLVCALEGGGLAGSALDTARTLEGLQALPVRPTHQLQLDPYLLAVCSSLAELGRLESLIRAMAHMIRDLCVSEVVVVGDLYDRGPRADLCLDNLMSIPSVTVAWGNHDIAWMGAWLGQKALIAFVLRVSCRYVRLSQLDEGYGISLLPLREFAEQLYGHDPCPRHKPKRQELMPTEVVRKMSKAIAIIQYKLDAQTIERHPEWGVANRRLLEGLDLQRGVITVDGQQWPLLDTNWPSFDPAAPYALSAAEEALMDKYVELFTSSQKLGRHMRFLVSHGSMWTVRDSHLCFHACIPVDEKGEYLTFPIDGKHLGGKELMDAIDTKIRSILEHPEGHQKDLLYYLWTGPASPLFGKAKMATLERDFIAEGPTWTEKKNPYYDLLHNTAFCEKILKDFGCDPVNGMVVNGHVPVKWDKGESPIKDSGKAVIIDGAFSEAYGDKGYTMVIKSKSTFMVEHKKFRGVQAFLEGGAEQEPTVKPLRVHPVRRLAADDVMLSRSISEEKAYLKDLVSAYHKLTVELNAGQYYNAKSKL